MQKRIIIVGGGMGGTMLANQLVTKLYPEILRGQLKIVLLSNSEDHFYKPAFMYVAFNLFFQEELKRPERSLLRPEIDFQVDEVIRFDFARQELRTLSGKRHGYDFLVIATGCLPAPERIEGLKEAGDHFYQYEPARQLAQRLSTIEKGRIFVTVSFPKTPNVPHQCGIAPIETTLMLDDFLRRRGVRDKVEIIYTYPTTAQLLRNCLFLQRPTGEILPGIFEQKNIRFQRGFTLSRVDPEQRIAYSEEGEAQPFDILMATPPIRAVDVVLESGVSQAQNNEGWLPTHHETLQVYGLEGVYVIGDTVDLPISKAGGACHNQAPVIANNIAAAIRLGSPNAVYDGRVQAVAQMGLNAGMPLWYDYAHDVTPTPPSKLGGLLRNGFNRGLYWAVARGML
ncbi:FAD/NAD(P)-binding oxidoreductase [Pseudomonas canadensis]|uniref:NAD(P)/FAD-dependent oxidoreductase n=1 Tax=Pseudomonas canadensis TaxID=915099 RepID=UPI00336A215D